jgi:hypothetical protein
MYAQFPRRPAQQYAARKPGTLLRRLAGVLAALTCALLAPVAIAPTAFAMNIPADFSGGHLSHGSTSPAVGMAGWQITLIALGAALVAAVVTLVLDRVLTARRPAPLPRPDMSRALR